MIEFNGVTKLFRQNVIFSDLSFKIDNSPCTAIVGRSGVGKTTIARMINGLEDYNSGKIFVNSIAVNYKNLRKVRQKVAFVFQNFNLFHNLTVIDNICYSPINVYGINREIVYGRAEDFLKRFSLLDFKDHYPIQLSGGQKQRVAIIRSLITQPSILILDEPTASLDPELTSEVINLIKELKKSVMVVMITHDMTVVRSTADNVLFIAKEKLPIMSSCSEFFSCNNKNDIEIFLQSIVV